MLMLPWENAQLDWSETGVDGARVTFEDVMGLIMASSEAEANQAYWRLDGVVCLNKMLFPAAENSLKLILAGLPLSKIHARQRCLELLGQIAAAESQIESEEIRGRCLTELRDASWMFFNGLQYDPEDMVWLYVDIIGILGTEYPDLRQRAKIYLREAAKRAIPSQDVDLINNTLAELEN